MKKFTVISTLIILACIVASCQSVTQNRSAALALPNEDCQPFPSIQSLVCIVPFTPVPTDTATNTLIPPTLTPTKTNTPIPPTPTSTKAIATSTSAVVPTSTPITPTPVGARTFYISTSGNDSNPGTQALPWKTFYKAVRTSATHSGDTVIALAGTYSEAIYISNSGITLQAQGKVITKNIQVGGDNNIVKGFTITDPTSDWGIRTFGNHNLVEGNEIYHTKQDGIWFFGTYNTFRDNYIHDILDPALPDNHVDCFQTWSSSGWSTTNILFDGNTCVNNSMKGPTSNSILMSERQTTTPLNGITFRNNVLVVYNPTYCSVQFWWDANHQIMSNMVIDHNTIVNMSANGNCGIELTNVSNATVTNNLLINWGSTHIPYTYVEGGSGIVINHNDIYNYSSTNGIPYGGVLPGDLWMVDPKITSLSNLDFHLQSNSPLCTAGTNGTYIGAYPCASGGSLQSLLLPPPTLGIDQFALNGIPANIDLMHSKYDFGWYQLTNGLSVNVMGRLAWPTYSKYYGGYTYFQPVPTDPNWFYQDWNIYTEEAARLFVKSMNGNYGGTAPMVDVEQPISEATLDRLFPNDTEAVQASKGKALYLRELQNFLNTVEQLTGKVPVIYTGKSFWEDVVGGSNALWATHYPLCVANYPYDNYSQYDYLNAVESVMNGGRSLPPIPIPRPWQQATYIQFTGRAPSYLVPGYAVGSNWAQTVDLNVYVPQTPSYPAYKALYNLNVRAVDSPTGTIIGIMWSGTIVYVDKIDSITGYSHFQPTTAFPGGGWIWTSYTQKQ